MSRRAARRPRPELKLHVEPLEARWLLNADGRRPRQAAPLAVESLLEARTDAPTFARELASHPGKAADLGLGALAAALRRHEGFAVRHGWAAELTRILDTHPHYAAVHHLTGLTTHLAAPTAGPIAALPPAAPVQVTATATPITAPATPPSPPAPPIVAQDPQSVAVGGYLDVTLPDLGLGTAGLTYTITPQPLPANMTFNRGTGELTFAPAPGQAGTYDFSVAISGGNRPGAVVVPVTVTDPPVPSTEISGQVVGAKGEPLAGMPVSIGTATAVTDAEGDFTLTGVPTNPGPISAGGSVAQAEDRLPLTAPVPQLLGHSIYLGRNNVLPKPLILPTVDWSSPSSFRQSSASEPVSVTNPAIPGFGIEVPSNPAAGAGPAHGTIQVAELPASLAAQHMPPGVGADLYLYRVTGQNLSQPVRVSLPGGPGIKPDTTLNLLTFNPVTGGHEILTPMVVSSNGASMVSAGVITLGPTGPARSSRSSQGVRPDLTTGGGGSTSPAQFSGCLYEAPAAPDPAPVTTCIPCQIAAAAAALGAGGGNQGISPASRLTSISPMNAASGSGGSGSSSGSGGSGSSSGGYSGSGSSGSGSGGSGGPSYGPVLFSDGGLVTGEYFLDHQLASYQAQGQSIGIDLQYSSAQADPNPVVQYEFTTPPGGDSGYITGITAQVALGGVSQGTGTTYPTPNGLQAGETYNIPMQVDASQLATGAYTYTMTVTEDFKIPIDDGDQYSESGGTENGPGDTDYYNTSITSTTTGSVTVINAARDPLGAGWSIGGLQHLSQVAPNGPVLITAGQQGTERYSPVYQDGQALVQDLGLASSTASSQILANDSSAGFAAPNSSPVDGGVLGTVSGDFNGDGKPDMAVVTGSTLAIQLNDGAGGFSAGHSYAIPSGYEAKALAVGNFSGHTNGVLDLAVLLASTSTNAYSVAEYTGNGAGAFAAPVITAAGNGVSSGTSPDTMVAADFNGDGLTDLAFNTDDGKADVMLATGAGSFGAATALSLPAGHSAIGIATTGTVVGGQVALVVQADNSGINEGGNPTVAVDSFTVNGSGTFSYASTYQTPAHPDPAILGLVAGDFQGEGLEVAVPVDNGDTTAYLDIVPLSSSGDWGQGVLHPVGSYGGYAPEPGNIVAADLNGTGKDSIALIDASAGQLTVLVPDPASDQFLPVETVAFGTTGGSGPIPVGTSGGSVGMIAVAAFMGTPARPAYRPPADTPATLLHDSDGTWTLSEPDGTTVRFNASGQETSIADRNGNTFTYAYFTSGSAAGALASITDPVGLVTTLAYDSSGHISTITDPAGRVTTFTVDSAGDLTRIEDPDGAVTQYGYNASHEADSETNPDNQTATAQYNSFGQFVSETLPGGIGTTTIDPAESNGLLAEGGSGPLPTSYAGSVTDPNRNTTTIAFNAQSHPAQQTSPAGGQSTIAADWRGFPSVVTDPMGRTTTTIYDGLNGQPLSITEAYPQVPGSPVILGQPTTATETFTYNDPYGIPTSITDFNGNTTTFTLDAHGNLREEQQPGGIAQEWTYNSAGQVLTHTDADGHTTSYTYDSLGRLTTITEPLPGSPTIKYTYDAAGDVTSVTDAVGDTTTYTYDPMGRLLTEQNPVQAAAGKDVSFTYDKAGNLLTVADAMGRVTTYTYNAVGKETSATDPMGRVTSYTYDGAGELTKMTDPMARVTTYTYDANHQLATVTDPMGGVTSDTYNADNQVTQTSPPNGPATLYSYDNLGNLTGVQAPVYYGTGEYMDVTVASYTYDPNGNRLTAVDGNGHTTKYTYNALNELTSVTDANNHTTSYTYDGNGNVLTTTDGLGHTTSDTYDALNRVVTETQPSGGGTTTYAYDAAGDLLSLTDPDGNVTRYTYTAAHQVATETLPTGGVYTYTYDLDGELTQVVDPDGHTIDYAYNADGQETSETWVNPHGGTPLDVFHYTYDDDGELTAVSDNNASYQYTYDNNGRVTSVSDAGSTGLPSVTLDYGYDKNGNRTSMTDSLGGVTSYTYDARNELTNLTFSGTGITPEAVKFTYDNQGNMTGLTRYSDLAQTQVVASTSYSYDPANQMTAITDANSAGTTLVSYGYTYDAAGRVTQETRTWASGASSDTLTYGYTNNDQLTSVTHTNASFANESFAWDANGNQTGTGYTTGTENEQTASPGYTYTYDADGNMITSTQTSTGDVWTYSYDYRNRMTGAVEKSSSGTILAQATYTYDALDNRIGLDENGVQTWTLYDGGQPVMDFTGSGSLATRYLNGPEGAIDTVVSRQSASGTVAWYLPDRLGTIRDLLSNTGSIIDHVDYSAFGTVLGESSPANGDRMMGFAGLQRDTVTGLNLAVHRVQNPGTGRWTSQDPLGFAGDETNLYDYVGNNTISQRDSSGLIVSIPGLIATGTGVPIPKTWAGGSGVPLPPARQILLSTDSNSGVPIWDIMTTDWNTTFVDGKEHGGWIYYNPKTRQYQTRPGPTGDGRTIDLSNPPCISGWIIVATWHTHPGPPGPANPSPADRRFAKNRGIYGMVIGGPFNDGELIYVWWFR